MTILKFLQSKTAQSWERILAICQTKTVLMSLFQKIPTKNILENNSPPKNTHFKEKVTQEYLKHKESQSKSSTEKWNEVHKEI